MLRWRLVWNVVWNIFPIVGATRKNGSSSFLAELFMHESDNEVWKVKKSIVGNPLNRKALWSLGKIWPCIHAKNYFFRSCRKLDRFRFESFETMCYEVHSGRKCHIFFLFFTKFRKFELCKKYYRKKIDNFCEFILHYSLAQNHLFLSTVMKL